MEVRRCRKLVFTMPGGSVMQLSNWRRSNWRRSTFLPTRPDHNGSGSSACTWNMPTRTPPGAWKACEPPRRLQVTTRETEESYRRGKGVPPYDEALDATLTADGDQTILVIEVRGMPLDAIAFYGVGWQIHAENLAAYLAVRTRGDTKARRDDLVPAYQELRAAWMQTAGARLLAVNRCSSAHMRTLAQDSRSAHRLLYLTVCCTSQRLPAGTLSGAS